MTSREKLFCGLPPREDDPPVELHILYQPGAETMQEGDEEGAERELAAVEREAKIVAARIHELVGTPFYDAKTETERPLRYRDMAVLMARRTGKRAVGPRRCSNRKAFPCSATRARDILIFRKSAP